MALVGAGVRLAGNPGRTLFGPNAHSIERNRWNTSGALLNFHAGEASVISGASQSNKWGRPAGYSNPYAWSLPIKGGGMASIARAQGVASLSATIITSRALSADLAGVGTITNAQLGLLTQLAAALTGTGTVTNADMEATLALAANLAGSGSITAALNVLAAMSANLNGTGSLTGSLSGNLAMAADILVAECADLTAADVAAAVWNAVAASYDLPGTMGEKMNDAGSASNPWTEIIEAGYTAEELLRLMAAVLLGKASGGGTATRTFRDVNDTIDRVEATVEVDGDRSAVNLDPS